MMVWPCTIESQCCVCHIYVVVPDGCGASFTVAHSLDYCVGGLVRHRHNKVRNAFGDLAPLVWGQVQRELIIQEPSDSVGVHWLQIYVFVMLGILSVKLYLTLELWILTVICSTVTLFCLVFSRIREEVFEDCRADFTPLCVSVDDMVGVETEFFLKLLSNHFSFK